MIKGIHHISLIASSEESVDFYSRLGFRENKRIDRDYDTVVLMSGFGLGLEVFIDPRHVKAASEPLGLRTLSLHVDDVEKTVKELGLGIGTIHEDWFGNRYVVIRDPDGTAIQLCEDKSLGWRSCIFWERFLHGWAV